MPHDTDLTPAPYENKMLILQLAEVLFATDPRIEAVLRHRVADDPEVVIGECMLRDTYVWEECLDRAERMSTRVAETAAIDV